MLFRTYPCRRNQIESDHLIREKKEKATLNITEALILSEDINQKTDSLTKHVDGNCNV